ncbi:hypothetical protein FB451DRAFT_1413115 [Mycena latifolia]|nr:hypothetical protein FB451DRAFT_1413115 [Mycena latifolia]
MAFPAYTNPCPQSQFSVKYFAGITIAGAVDLIQGNHLPHILPRDSIQKWVFDRTEPTVSGEITLAANETIPCGEDMYPITQAAEYAFYHEGARSICLQIGQKIVRYHLSKIRLIMNVNNQACNLHAAACLLERVVASSLLLPALIEELKLNKFSEHLAGFHVTDAPLYALGCLLDERWAMEDILNARAELIYFRRGANFIDEEPSFLFLPTSFINDCRTLLALPNTPFSPEVIRLRER